MSQSNIITTYSNEVTPFVVDPVSGLVYNRNFKPWQNYETPKSPSCENISSDIPGYTFLLGPESGKFQKLFNPSEHFHRRRHFLFTEIMFKTTQPLDEEQFRAIMSNVEGMDEVFTWIPDENSVEGRKICFASIRPYSPLCIIIGVTDAEGKIRKVMVSVTMFSCVLIVNLNIELANFANLEGHLNFNRNLGIEGIKSPRLLQS